uniref:Lipocalin/cytosolic fatty-acid binding domain-containing protein n=1 Tax=Mus spicilegus TaxID=10103 RepID=A0A8C6IBH6_MUSSI
MTMKIPLLMVALILPSVENLFFRNPQYTLTLEQLLGKWYITRWAGNLPIPAKKKLTPLPPFVFVKNVIGKLEFRMNISKPIGCVQFKIYMDEDRYNSNIFYIWPKFSIVFRFIGGTDFAIAAHVGKFNREMEKVTMLMGRHMAPTPTVLLDFEDFVESLILNKTDIINPGCDDSCELSGQT